MRPTLGAFLRAGLGLEAHSWPQRTGEVFVIQWTFGPVSVPPDNNILLNNIKNRWPGAAPIIGIVEFPHITSKTF